jgi:hypothetical protein
MTPSSCPDHTERSTLAVCIAHVAGAAARDVSLDPEEQRAWLAERGLVPVQDAAAFTWAGPWIARRQARDGSGPRAVVMFGVPSGAIWDPADTTDEILDGSVLAALDLAAWPPHTAAEAGMSRYRRHSGRLTGPCPTMATASSTSITSALTLIDAAVLDTFGGDPDHRRNVVVRGTDLNALIGHEFTLGEARCHFMGKGTRPVTQRGSS